jgi:hypothetical protein
VDPLVITGRGREGVDALLRDLEPVAAVDFLAELRLQALVDLLLGHGAATWVW